MGRLRAPKLRDVRSNRYSSALRRAVRHPHWFAENARGWARRRLAGQAIFDPTERGIPLLPAEIAVSEAIGIDPARYRATRDELLPHQGGHLGELAARRLLREVVGVVVRELRPAVMVETGVARGASTAVALAAMDANGSGRLYSVDLPPLALGEDRVGELVPARLRERWTLELGPAREVLPRLLAEVPLVDVFLHDAEHTYKGQLQDLRQAWPSLSPRGVVICDDVINAAFVDFAAEVSRTPYLIRSPGHADPIGIMSAR
jgi:hypothetical protein